MCLRPSGVATKVCFSSPPERSLTTRLQPSCGLVGGFVMRLSRQMPCPVCRAQGEHDIRNSIPGRCQAQAVSADSLRLMCHCCAHNLHCAAFCRQATMSAGWAQLATPGYAGVPAQLSGPARKPGPCRRCMVERPRYPDGQQHKAHIPDTGLQLTLAMLYIRNSEPRLL